MSEDDSQKKVEIKLLWLTHTLRESEKKSLEECVMELILGEPTVDQERERIAFNKGLIWAAEYLANRRND